MAALTVKTILKGYPDPVECYKRNPGDYCLMGIVCDYAVKNKGFEWAGNTGLQNFPGASRSNAALKILNPALADSQGNAYDLASTMIEFNDSGRFDEAKFCLDQVLAFKGDSTELTRLAIKWANIADGILRPEKEIKAAVKVEEVDVTDDQTAKALEALDETEF